MIVFLVAAFLLGLVIGVAYATPSKWTLMQDVTTEGVWLFITRRRALVFRQRVCVRRVKFNREETPNPDTPLEDQLSVARVAVADMLIQVNSSGKRVRELNR